MRNIKFWKISDFVEEIKQHLEIQNLHINTVDGWFKRLESDRIHYINRTEDTNEKIYDELDLKIALFIKKRREEKWSLTAISNDLHNFFELRAFPKNEVISEQHVVNIEDVKVQITKELRKTFEEIATTKLEEMKNHYEKMIHSLPKPPSLEEQKEQRFQEMVIRRRVESKLEQEANLEWSKLPDTERLKKVGLFRKETDIEKRNQFVRTYVDKHFEDLLRKELNL